MRDLVTAFDQAVQAAPAETIPAKTVVSIHPKTPEPPVAVQPVRLTMPPTWILAAAGLGLAVLVIAGLILSRVPGRVEISGGQVEVILPTATPTTPVETQAAAPSPTAPAATRTPRPTATPTAPPAPTQFSDSTILTDLSWKMSANPAPGWEQPGFDDSGWPAAKTEPCRRLPGIEAQCLWDYPYRYVENKSIAFRKVFDVPQVPPRARLVTLVDDDVDIYVNGRLALHDGPDTNSMGISWWEIDITEFLQPGKNVLALQGIDTGQGAAQIQAVLGLCADSQDTQEPLIEIMGHVEDWFDGFIYLEAIDAPCDSGVAEVAYRVNDGPWQPVERHHRFQLPPGEHDVEARAADKAGRHGFDRWHFRVGPAPEAPALTEPFLSVMTSRPPDFAADFNAADPAWNADDYDDRGGDQISLENGQLQITVGGARPLTHVGHPALRFNNFILSVDVTAQDPNPANYSPQLSWQDTHQTLALWINQHRWETRYCQASGCEANTAEGVDANITAGKTMQLMVAAHGPEFAVYLNGKPLTTVNDPNRPPGTEMTLAAYSDAVEQSTLITYDNLKVWNLDGAAGQ
jgi:hypothetical protein